MSRNKFQIVCLVWAWLSSLWLTACPETFAGQVEPKTPLKGNIVFWAVTEEIETEALQELLTRFTDLYPEVHVLPTFFPSFQEFWKRMNTAIICGLGPDLVLLPTAELPELPELDELGWIQVLDAYGIDTTAYMPAALYPLQDQSGLYGVPFTVSVYILYYNTVLTTKPPATLTDLLDQARAGQTVLLNTDFYEAFWGVTAYGGRLFDEADRVVADQQGFADWLRWLKAAQEVPSLILSADAETLISHFEQGKTAYYIGSTQELPRLRRALGQETLGVAPLPDGPQPARGFSQALAFMACSAAAAHNKTLAVTLTQFLTNAEQQRKLSMGFEHVPVNVHVQLDVRLAPVVAVLQQQARKAIPYYNTTQMERVLDYGTQLTTNVLEGVLTPDEAAAKFSAMLVQEFGQAAKE